MSGKSDLGKFGFLGAADIVGDVIEGGLIGAGKAIGGTAQGIGFLAGGLAQGAGAALGGALQGALTEPDVYINSYGTTGAYAKSTIKTTVKIQIPNGPERIEATEDMPLEKLMSIAIKYLSSISKNLRNQSIAENKNNEQERLANRESLIEKPDVPVPVAVNDQKIDGKKKMSGTTKALLGLGALTLGASALGKIDLSKLDDLGKNIAEFKKQYGWMIKLAGVASLALWVVRLPGLKSLIAAGVRAAGVKSLITAGFRAVASTAGATAIGVASLVGAGAAAIYAPFDMNQKAKDGGKRALSIGEQLKSKYGIDTKTESKGGIPFNTYTMNEKPLNNEYQKLVEDYTNTRSNLSEADLDKKYKNLALDQSPKGNSRVEYAINYFKSRDWSHEQASGIVGNLLVESPGLNPHPKPGDGGEAYGIAQWHPDRQAKFKEVVGKNIRSSNLDEQLFFVDWELKNTNKKAGNLLKGAKTAGLAAAIVDDEYERSSGQHKGRRIATAEALASGDFKTPAPDTYSQEDGFISEAKEMISNGYEDLMEFIKVAGKTDTQFRPLTSKAGGWDKSIQLLKDQAKIEADLAMGRKEDKVKNQSAINTPTSSLRTINGGTLDVIDPNYRLGNSEGILASYIMNFSADKRVWA